jgi:hypothetical protein
VALAGFGLDSLIEIGASTVVIWELAGTGEERQRRGLRLIGSAFAALAVYLLVQSTAVLAAGYHPRRSVPGIIWTAVTAAAMFALAAGKARTGRALDNPVLRTEGRVTMIDGILAVAVLLSLALNAALGWWWADPAAGYVPHQRVAYWLGFRRRRRAGAGWWSGGSRGPRRRPAPGTDAPDELAQRGGTSGAHRQAHGSQAAAHRGAGQRLARVSAGTPPAAGGPGAGWSESSPAKGSGTGTGGSPSRRQTWPSWPRWRRRR